MEYILVAIVIGVIAYFRTRSQISHEIEKLNKQEIEGKGN